MITSARTSQSLEHLANKPVSYLIQPEKVLYVSGNHGGDPFVMLGPRRSSPTTI